ncbi:MAG: competence protein CoiA family protein [Chlamydiota bacterium]|nr:competence protein CoiA family protein [Chlamydiota bacterium]
MQLFARDNQGHITPADEADKQEEYFCLECGSGVRLRGGLHRRKHFYHLQQDRQCRLGGKSLVHLQVQCFIKNLLPPGESLLERRFDEIDRIADVCWENKKIIFEVQCSPISSQEIAARNADYKSLGYEVVWILHDSRYNRLKVSAAEHFLVDSPHYFTNIDLRGEGIVYDQISAIKGRIRNKLGAKLTVHLNSFSHMDKKNKSFFPLVESRRGRWPLYFEGDLIDAFICGALTEKQKRFLAKESFARVGFIISIFTSLSVIAKRAREMYLQFLRFMVENACKG